MGTGKEEERSMRKEMETELGVQERETRANSPSGSIRLGLNRPLRRVKTRP
jgi:hypothetical protein